VTTPENRATSRLADCFTPARERGKMRHHQYYIPCIPGPQPWGIFRQLFHSCPPIIAQREADCKGGIPFCAEEPVQVILQLCVPAARNERRQHITSSGS